MKSYPAGAGRLELVTSFGSRDLSKVNLFLYLEHADKPTLAFSMCATDNQMAKDLACTIALSKLKEIYPFRNHFDSQSS